MFVSMKMIFYICTVKSFERYEAAATSSVFCAHNILEETKRKECGRSNAHKVTARKYLTAPIALLFMSN